MFKFICTDIKGGTLKNYYHLSGFEKFMGYNLKVCLIVPGYFFFLEKYIQDARIERKVLINLGFTLSKQKRSIGLFYGFIVLFYCSL